MKRVYQYFPLPVAAVRQLDFGIDSFAVGILRSRHGYFKGHRFPEAQLFQGFYQVIAADPQGRLRKINIIGVNEGIFQGDRLVSVKCGHIIISPTRVLLPLQPFVSIIHIRINRSGFKADSRYHRLKGRAGTQFLTEPVVKRKPLILIQTVPERLGHTIYEIPAVKGRRTHQGQYLPGKGIHSH